MGIITLTSNIIRRLIRENGRDALLIRLSGTDYQPTITKTEAIKLVKPV